MIDIIRSIVRFLTESKSREVVPAFSRRLNHSDFKFIRRVVDSSLYEAQIHTAIEWINRMHRKGFFSTEIYHELVHHAMYKEEELIKEKVHKDIVLPYIRKRAEEIAREERAKKIRIVKTEVN